MKKKTIEKISDNIGLLLKTKEYQNEFVDDMIRKNEYHCKCKCEFPPEGLFAFINKCFQSEKFLRNSGDLQSRLLNDIFEKCTDIQIDENIFKKIVQS